MSRRHQAERRYIKPDAHYESILVAKFTNAVMWDGKKSRALEIVYGAIEDAAAQLGVSSESKSALFEVLNTAILNVKPAVEVRSRRVGGSTYQVPTDVRAERSQALAIRWIVSFARKNKGIPMQKALTNELVLANKNQGSACKKREETHRMAEANKAFSHFRW